MGQQIIATFYTSQQWRPRRDNTTCPKQKLNRHSPAAIGGHQSAMLAGFKGFDLQSLTDLGHFFPTSSDILGNSLVFGRLFFPGLDSMCEAQDIRKSRWMPHPVGTWIPTQVQVLPCWLHRVWTAWVFCKQEESTVRRCVRGGQEHRSNGQQPASSEVFYGSTELPPFFLRSVAKAQAMCQGVCRKECVIFRSDIILYVFLPRPRTLE